MATITKVCRKSGDAYKAVIRLRGVKPFSKTFRLRKHAKAWAERMERDRDEARAYGPCMRAGSVFSSPLWILRTRFRIWTSRVSNCIR